MNSSQQEGTTRFPKKEHINPLINHAFSIGSFLENRRLRLSLPNDVQVFHKYHSFIAANGGADLIGLGDQSFSPYCFNP